MKKACIILLAITVLLILPNAAFAESVNSANEFLLLEKLGIADADESRFDSSVTRGEFCIAIIKALNLFDAYSGQTSEFIDITGDEDLQKAVFVAEQLGIVSGVNDKEFAPDREISYQEMIKITVSALGYDYLAESMGTYPQGYIKMAQSLGLTDGVAMSDTVTRQDMLRLLYNALDTKVAEYSSYSYNYSIKKGELTLMNAAFNLYKARGVVMQTSKINLTNESDITGGYVRIDNSIHKCTNDSLNDFVGKKIEFYYFDDDDLTVLCANPGYDPNVTYEVSAENVNMNASNASRKVIVYQTDTGSRKQIKLDNYVTVVYNDKRYEDFDKDTFDIENGRLVIIDNNADGAGDVVLVYEYVDYIVKSVTGDDTVYTTDGNILEFGKSADVYEILDAENQLYEFSDIQEGSVLSVQESRDKSIIKIYLNNKTLAGKASEFFSDINCNKVRIDDVEYILSEKFTEENSGVRVGTDYEWYINAFGKIVGIRDSDGELFGYILSTTFSEDSEDDATITFFGSNGIIKTYSFANKPLLNGVKMTAKQIVSGAEIRPDGKTKKQLVNFRLVSGKIKEINTAVPKNLSNKDTPLVFEKQVSSYIYRYGIFGGGYLVDEDTTIINIPAAGSDKADDPWEYAITYPWELVVNSKYDLTLYNVSEVNHVGIMLVTEVSSKVNIPVMLFNKVVTFWDEEEGEVRQQVCGLIDGAMNTYDVKDGINLDSYERGDVLELTFSSKGEITNISRLVGRKTGNNYFTSYLDPSEGGNERDNFYGKVCFKSGTYLGVTTDGTNISGISISGNIYVYDSQNDSVYMGAADDIYASGYTGDAASLNGSTIFMRKCYDAIQDIVIFK